MVVSGCWRCGGSQSPDFILLKMIFGFAIPDLTFHYFSFRTMPSLKSQWICFTTVPIVPANVPSMTKLFAVNLRIKEAAYHRREDRKLENSTLLVGRPMNIKLWLLCAWKPDLFRVVETREKQIYLSALMPRTNPCGGHDLSTNNNPSGADCAPLLRSSREGVNPRT